VLNSIEATMQTEALLKQSQELAAELQARQGELQQTNEQLGQKAQQLAEQNAEVERKNKEIEQARFAVEEKAKELAITSKYKSDFLANMSHELRTPLNSILVLGQQLSGNPDGNLTEKQVEFARTIHAAGTDLLNLITDILDLSKIESGTVSVEAGEVVFTSLLEAVARPFRHESEEKKLSFDVHIDPQLPHTMVTDSKRLQQILKNLLSNAFKFTEKGGISLSAYPVKKAPNGKSEVLGSAEQVVAFEVTDTGIGIPVEKQRTIFEAFQQADAGTSRRYGGTGLGLAISRELAGLLGGEIQLQSTPGGGSTFTLYLPLRHQTVASPSRVSAPTKNVVNVIEERELEKEPVDDDRDAIQTGDLVLLIIEDDPHFARLLCDLSRDNGFRVLLASRGADGLELAHRFHPTAISLDVFLPDMLGWTVLNHLKQDPDMRHIPVQMLTLDEDRRHGLSRGAFAFVTKPAPTKKLEEALARIKDYVPRRKRLLVVEDNPLEQFSIRRLLDYDDIDMVVVGRGADALKALKEQIIDCVVLDLRLPDMSGIDLLERLSENTESSDVPVVVFTGKVLSVEEDARLRMLARSVIVKRVESPERLLDETALFLHRLMANLPAEKQALLEQLHRSDEALVGKKVLVVDDDVRNIFAVASVLERHGMKVVTAETGQEALAKLASNPDMAVVLMDIMMPGMDGYETIRAIRQTISLGRLPIIALTAKAMKGDREKCFDAGASEYLAKPVNTEQLQVVLRTLLHP
jgi:CheY-like chemotaxis protein/signal transduction histidine kinase